MKPSVSVEDFRLGGGAASALEHEADSALSAKDYEKAVALASRGAESSPLNFNFLRMRAHAKYHLLRFAEAIVDAEAVLSAVPDDALMAQIVVFSAIFSGDLDQAKRATRDAFKHHPDHVAFLYFSCKTAQSGGDQELALQLARRMLLLHGELPEVHALAADCFVAKGLVQDARRHLEKVIELGGGNHLVFCRLACIYLGERNPQQALVNFLAAIDAGRPGNDAHIGAAYCYLGLDDLSRAREMCEKAFTIGPVDVRAWKLRVCVAAALSDDVAARAAIAEIEKANTAARIDTPRPTVV